MDKNAIKKYAVWARNELIARVSQKAQQYGITVEGYGDKNADSVNGVLLSVTEKKQRQALITKIDVEGFEQVMEEVAYTWFNRFTALRFMEVNNYLPSHTRIFTNEANEFKPQILADAISLELEGLDMDKVFELKNANKDEELYKYLLIVQCNALSSILPGMFQKIADYTELLLPDYLLREGSVIEQMITLIPESDWTDQVQIIGWLYQYYNIDTFNAIYDGDMSRKKISKNLVPAATQMFTPDWVVRYMVENSLGYIWIGGHQDSKLKENWKYFIDNEEQTAEVTTKIDQLYEQYANITPKSILCIDPCMGSGHILCYIFDVLVQIYESCGYTSKEAVENILKYNLWGLDIDDRAAQLAYFAVMMKARQYDRRIFSKGIQPHVHAITESNGITDDEIKYFSKGEEKLEKDLRTIIEELYDAKEYGSILEVSVVDFEALYKRFEEISNEISLFSIQAMNKLYPLIQTAEALSQKYDVCITNPPYLNSSRMSTKLNSYVKDKFPGARSDLAMVMFEAIGKNMSKEGGAISLVTTTSWMFISSFEEVRDYVVKNLDFQSIVDFGTELFEGKIGHLPIVAWCNINRHLGRKFNAVRLEEYCYAKRVVKQEEFFNRKNYYVADEGWFEIIDGNPLCYWISDAQIRAFQDNPALVTISPPRTGMMTTNNKLFLREWYEVDINRISFNSDSIENSVKSGKRWFPYNKGGNFQKWYGNRDLIVNWEDEGRDIIAAGMTSFRGKDFYFKEGLTWTIFGYDNFAVRLSPTGAIFDIGGTSTFPPRELMLYILGYLNSRVASDFITLINPTVNIQNGDIKRLPIIVNSEAVDEVTSLVEQCVALTRSNYDSNEVSWDFERNPLLQYRVDKISEAYDRYVADTLSDFQRLKDNEEHINRIFARLYNVEDTTQIEVAEKKVSIHVDDEVMALKKYISFAVGCMFGRYSVDKKGLIYAGGDFNSIKGSFNSDIDNIIPISSDEYFQDDIVVLFVEFVRVTFGEMYLEENLQYVARVIGGEGLPRDIIRNYFCNEFFNDHVRMYQKAPIYWLFDSGKKNGFKCLIYMHRYQPDTIARIRTDYVHEQQSRYRTVLADLEQRINGASTSERVKLNKQLKTIQDKAEELRKYEEKIHHLADQMISIDLDDGVKVNYAKFQDVLAKIK